MFRLVYTILFALCMPFVYLKLLWRGYRAPEYRLRKLQRFGLFKAPELHRCIWVHAVSVGEVLAAEPIVREIQLRFPERDVVITSMTPTSSEQIKKRFGDNVFHVYVPYDLPFMVNAFLKRVRPELLIIMETELWPNMIHQVSKRKCPVVIANARLSERSAKGYRRLKPAVGWMLNELSLVLCQNQNDASRFCSLGISEDKIHVTGSVKFDMDIDDSHLRLGKKLRRQLPDSQQVWIAASTHEGEDELVLEVHAKLRVLFPSAVLILVPRHPERFDAAYLLSAQAGFKTYKRTEHTVIPQDADVFVGDVMGELLALYGASNVAFIGGSLVEVGGHNPIEPGALGLPVIAGPHIFNFEAICQQLVKTGGMQVVPGADGLLEAVSYLFSHTDEAQQRGQNVLREIEASKGAVNRVVDYLSPFFGEE